MTFHKIEKNDLQIGSSGPVTTELELGMMKCIMTRLNTPGGGKNGTRKKCQQK